MVVNSEARWAGLRRLREGAAPTFDLLAAATGRAEGSIRRRAEREGWGRPAEPRDAVDTVERVRRLIDPMLAELEALNLRASESGATLDKARIDRVTSLIRAVEKLGEITRSLGAKEDPTKRDADMAVVLKRIDRRIIELATGYAKKLCADRADEPGNG